MKTIELVCPEGITYRILNVPDNEERTRLELFLATGRMRHLEDLGIYTYEYSRLISEESPVIPILSDYIQAIRQAYGGIGSSIIEAISHETGESLSVVERWMEEKEVPSLRAEGQLRTFILKGRTNLN